MNSNKHEVILRIIPELKKAIDGYDSEDNGTSQALEILLDDNLLTFQSTLWTFEETRGGRYYIGVIYDMLNSLRENVFDKEPLSDKIETDWLMPIRKILPGLVSDKEQTESKQSVNRDPDGYGKAGEMYIGLSAILVEQPEYPRLSKELLRDRLRDTIAGLQGKRGKGPKTSRYLAYVQYLGFLSERPGYKTIVRELGVNFAQSSYLPLSEDYDEDRHLFIGSIEPWLKELANELTK